MLEVQDLTLHYGQSQVLYDVALTAKRGEVTCLMGANGVGKTSLLKAISGRHPRSGGEVSLDGEALGVWPAHRLASMGIAYVPQGRQIFPMLTVTENLETGFACLPRGDHRIPERIYELFPVLRDMAERRGGISRAGSNSSWRLRGR